MTTVPTFGRLLPVAALCLAAACHSRKTDAAGATGAGWETRVVAAGAECTDQDIRSSKDLGQVDLLINAQPAPRAGAEASVRITGSRDQFVKITVNVNPGVSNSFMWRADTYELRVDLPGYPVMQRSITVRCNSVQEVRVDLTRKR